MEAQRVSAKKHLGTNALISDELFKEGIIMLENSKAFSGFAAPDIAEEKKFYSETLGLKTSERPWPAHTASGRRQ